MIDKIVSLLNEVIEKHLLPSLFSVVVTAVIFYITPNNYGVLTKLGKTFYIVTLFCLVLFIVEIIPKIYIKVSNKKYYSRQEKERKKQDELEFEKQLFRITDSLSPEDMKIIYYFLKNGNKQ